MTDSIPGLRYVPCYLNAAEQTRLLTTVDALPWLDDLQRRVQHYGCRYDYRARRVDQSMYLGPLPDWAASLADQLHADGFITDLPDQVIVNEYLPGQGIAAHVDCLPCFGDTILSLSLGSPCVMVFSRLLDDEKVPVLLEPGSLVVMAGESRCDWKHGIPRRKTDVLAGREVVRGRRVSLTFRTVVF